MYLKAHLMLSTLCEQFCRTISHSKIRGLIAIHIYINIYRYIYQRLFIQESIFQNAPLNIKVGIFQFVQQSTSPRFHLKQKKSWWCTWRSITWCSNGWIAFIYRNVSIHCIQLECKQNSLGVGRWIGTNKNQLWYNEVKMKRRSQERSCGARDELYIL